MAMDSGPGPSCLAGPGTERLSKVLQAQELCPPSPAAAAARRFLGWRPARLCTEAGHGASACNGLASSWLERPACPAHYGEDLERVVSCVRFEAWMTWREAADPTARHAHRPVLPNGEPWYFGDVCPGPSVSAGYHEAARVTRRVEDAFGALWLCDTCAGSWRPAQPADFPFPVDFGDWAGTLPGPRPVLTGAGAPTA